MDLRRSIASALRLAHGALRLPIAVDGLFARRSTSLASIDVFNTILKRKCDESAAEEAGNSRLREALRRRNLPYPRSLRESRRAIEGELSAELIAEGKDPEFSHSLVLERLLVSLGAGDWAASEAADAAASELEFELQETECIPAAIDWIRDRRRAGSRIVAVSDTRYGSREVKRLLEHHGVQGISAVYASSDYAASKFSGRLFDLIVTRERVDPSCIIHAGDNFLTDWLSPAQRGLALHLLRSPNESNRRFLPAAPETNESATDGAYALGYEVVGPILSAFTLMLLQKAQQDGVNRLAFVARDGALLLEITRCFLEHMRGRFAPELTYLGVSRRLLSGWEGKDNQGGGFHPLLIAYLRAERIFARGVGLVDVGWRGTIQMALARLAQHEGQHAPRGYYLGLWNEDGGLPPKDQAVGLLCDQRRGRSLKEGAAWHAAFLLEAICRANQGMIISLVENDSGRIAPVSTKVGKARDAERESEPVKNKIWSGALDYANWCADTASMDALPEIALRQGTQNLLYRLAFFPTENEQRLGLRLVHTEAEKPEWASPLILPRGQGLGGRLAGLRSPWKGGYLAENGNWFLSISYCAAEAAFSRCPGLKSAIRRWLPRASVMC